MHRRLFAAARALLVLAALMLVCACGGDSATTTTAGTAATVAQPEPAVTPDTAGVDTDTAGMPEPTSAADTAEPSPADTAAEPEPEPAAELVYTVPGLGGPDKLGVTLPDGPAPIVTSADTYQRLLDQLTVRPATTFGGYSITRFGAPNPRQFGLIWADHDGDGCTTREEVLIEEAVRSPTVVRDPDEWAAIRWEGSRRFDFRDTPPVGSLAPAEPTWTLCVLRGGLWIGAYSGYGPTPGDWLPGTELPDAPLAMPAASGNGWHMDIDHMVPLTEAWISGAWSWDDTTRAAYANDLAYPDALSVVTPQSNRAKGVSDPSVWTPRLNPETRCWYTGAWITVKWRWGLTVDQAEHDALRGLLDSCEQVHTSMLADQIGQADVQLDPNAAEPEPHPPTLTTYTPPRLYEGVAYSVQSFPCHPAYVPCVHHFSNTQKAWMTGRYGIDPNIGCEHLPFAPVHVTTPGYDPLGLDPDGDGIACWTIPKLPSQSAWVSGPGLGPGYESGVYIPPPMVDGTQT